MSTENKTPIFSKARVSNIMAAAVVASGFKVKKKKTRLQFHPQFHLVDAWGGC